MLRYWNRLIKMYFDRLKKIFVRVYMNGKNNWCFELKDSFNRMDFPDVGEKVIVRSVRSRVERRKVYIVGLLNEAYRDKLNHAKTQKIIY